MLKTKFLYLFILAFFLTLGNVYSQEDSTRIFKTNSIQFRMQNLLSLSSFKGALISYKYHTNDQNAFRFGINLYVRKWVEDETDEYFRSDTTFYNQKRDHNNMQIELIAEYLRYINPTDKIKMFFGIGPRAAFTINNFDTDEASSSDNVGHSYTQKYNNDHYEFGLTASYGLEWMFMQNMSLHAEYGFNISYFYDYYARTYKRENITPPDTIDNISEERTGFVFDDAGALLGISIYF